MKLLNYTTVYFAGIVLFVIAIWAGIFYFSMLREIYDSIDDGLDNQKGLVIQKAAIDTTILTRSRFEESDYAITEITAAEATRFRDIYMDTSMYMQNEDDYEPVRLLKTAFMQNGRYYRLSVATSMVEEDDLTRQLLLSIIWLYLGLVIVILLLNNFLLRRIWAPFYQLLSQLKKFRIDRPAPVKMQPTKVEEFRLLNETVQKMLHTNASTYESQKQFIENASHELQTPLAISINKLEQLAESKQLGPDQLTLLSSSLDSLERMTRLNKALLLLTRIENRQFHETSPVNFNALCKSVVEDFADQLEFNKITAEITEKSECTHTMNQELAVILVTNLVKNAIVHNTPGGYVKVLIDKNYLLVQNSGTRQELDTSKLFTRFYRGNTKHSTGLGLPIVKAISTLYGFSISYQFTTDHTLRLDFRP